MDAPDPSALDPEESDHGIAGPLILGVPWPVSHELVRAAARLAAGLDLHLVCAYVDPASYLTEWEPPQTLTAASLDPAGNEEAAYPASEVRAHLEGILGPGAGWSFRVINGDVSSALCRLADSIGASMFVVGGGRAGILPRITRALEGSVPVRLTRIQDRPVVVVPEHTVRSRETEPGETRSTPPTVE
jgi:hypothetical protein